MIVHVSWNMSSGSTSKGKDHKFARRFHFFFWSWFCSSSGVIWTFRMISKAKLSSFFCSFRIWSQIWSPNTTGSNLSIAKVRLFSEIYWFSDWVLSVLQSVSGEGMNRNGLLTYSNAQRCSKRSNQRYQLNFQVPNLCELEPKFAPECHRILWADHAELDFIHSVAARNTRTGAVDVCVGASYSNLLDLKLDSNW